MVAELVESAADYMAILVDAECGGVESSGIVEGGVDAAVVEEAVLVAVAVRVKPNDLARAVDAFRNSAGGAEWIVVRGSPPSRRS